MSNCLKHDFSLAFIDHQVYENAVNAITASIMQPNKNSHIRKMYWFVAKKDMSLCLPFDSLSKGKKKKQTVCGIELTTKDYNLGELCCIRNKIIKLLYQL